MRGRDKYVKYGRKRPAHIWQQDGTYADCLRTICGAMTRLKEDVVEDKETRLCDTCQREERKCTQ